MRTTGTVLTVTCALAVTLIVSQSTPAEAVDGLTWELVTIPGLPAGSTAWRVWTDQPNSAYVWAVRTLPGTTTVPESFLYHWDGVNWIQELHLSGYSGDALFGTGPADIFASVSGCDRTTDVSCSPAPESFIYHFDGSAWTPQTLPPAARYEPVTSISGIPEDVIAATAYHNILRNIMGGGWNVAYTPGNIYNILLLAPDDAHFTGCNRRGWWDGTSWHDGYGGNPCDMYDLWGMRDSAGVLHMYTVGNPGYSYYVGVWRYAEGSHWYSEVFRDASSPSYEAGSAYGVWGSAPDDVYVAGRRGDWSVPLNGAIYHFDGTGWQRLWEVGSIPNVEDVWGSSAYDVWFTLGNGQLLHLHDTTPPILDACPVAGPFIQGSGPQTVGPIGVDASVSGLDAGASALTGLVETASVGSRSVTFTAVDNAGNSASATCSYQVIFDWAGFFQPATNPPVLNQVKAGQAIPMKFSLAGNQGLDILAAGSPASQQIACDSSAPVDDIEQTVTAGNSSLSYDPASDQYTYVWKTGKAWTGTCRQLIVTLADGTEQRANFKFK